MDLENNRLTAGMQIGDYLLTALIYDGPTTRTWEAQQISIEREVIIDSLNWEQQQDDIYASTFMSDVRAKAAIDHPLIGSVFEAVRDERLCFYAREKLSGDTLQFKIEAKDTLSPYSVAHILRQIAEANLYLEEHHIDSLPLQADQIFISEQSLCRIVNIAVGGERDHAVSTTDKQSIAAALIPLLEDNLPGSTRTKSLLDFMADQEREIPLSWEQIRELSEGVEHHITNPTQPLVQNEISQRIQRRGQTKKIVTIGLVTAFVALAAFGINTLMNQPVKPKARDLSSRVHIPAGNYATHDNGSATLPEFWIDSHEVTIAEYADFLQDMDLFDAEQRSAYQHPEQPDTKASHAPAHWDELYSAAIEGAQWNGLDITPNHPVVGVDWWDAFAYSSYRKCSLPSSAQWLAALSYSSKDGDSISPSEWGAVDQASEDITNSSIHGLAGNVLEWSSTISKDPSFPTKPKTPILLGGSFRKHHNSASSREWTNEGSYGTQLDHLGFRTVSTTAPTE